ncbi:Blue-light photoreceptor PHR2 [Hibiscus syriacus]|uniref:Blue-light photoreceptor PHR2 n=1 Tax=Hibiscus syriacus TaxID=106335 RepID=A0A6A3A761_HIBSY|nr:blue-light photoreceptor PHR2-like [Hibiscus syriacus]KAE8699607.1 Blue-light photoreceptor PHR2 [Hibiscus syriacus]
MDSNTQSCETPEMKSSEEHGQTQVSQPPFATASLSLSSLPTTLPTQFFIQPKTLPLFSSQSPSKVKVPTQASSLSTLSLSSTSPSPYHSKYSLKATFANNPLQSPLSLGPRRPLDPSNGAAIRRASIVWFRNDLRVHDNECLDTANKESMSVLPIYCFDPRDYGKSSSGFDKTGPYRATFLIESVSDLRKNLQARGSDLVVRIGNPESVLVELAKAIGADAIYAHREVSHDEVKAEEKIEAAMKEEGVEVKYFWGSTLFHVDDLPFKLEDMPSNYGGFKEKVKGLEIRKTIEALDQMKGMPSRGDVETGDIPSLADLGLNPTATMAQDGRRSVSATMAGGENEALQRLNKYAAECRAQPYKWSKDGSQGSIYGANFSCKISPWLAMGCLSPRFMFDEIKKTANRTISATSKKSDGGSGSPDTQMNWLMFELLWRDFFRFITKKYSHAKVGTAPATACTGSLA